MNAEATPGHHDDHHGEPPGYNFALETAKAIGEIAKVIGSLGIVGPGGETDHGEHHDEHHDEHANDNHAGDHGSHGGAHGGSHGGTHAGGHGAEHGGDHGKDHGADHSKEHGGHGKEHKKPSSPFINHGAPIHSEEAANDNHAAHSRAA